MGLNREAATTEENLVYDKHNIQIPSETTLKVH